jgi:hypothetical protein
VGWTAVGLGVAGAGVGVALSALALSEASGSSPSESQRDAAARNDRVHTYDTGAAIGYVAGGVAATAGVLLLLWPESTHVTVSASGRGVSLGYAGHF